MTLYEDMKGMLRDFDPIGTKLGKKHKNMIELLMKEGYRKKDIKSFTKLYESEVEEYIDLVREAQKRAKAMLPTPRRTSTKPRTTSK